MPNILKQQEVVCFSVLILIKLQPAWFWLGSPHVHAALPVCLLQILQYCPSVQNHEHYIMNMSVMNKWWFGWMDG